MVDTTILTEDEVMEIEARANAATEGPWSSPANVQPWVDEAACLSSIITRDGGYIYHRNWKQVCANMDFISQARTDIPELCQTVRALRAALEESEAHGRMLRERLVVADGVYDARGEYTFRAQTAIHRATSELRDQLAALTQERDALWEQVRKLNDEVAKTSWQVE